MCIHLSLVDRMCPCEVRVVSERERIRATECGGRRGSSGAPLVAGLYERGPTTLQCKSRGRRRPEQRPEQRPPRHDGRAGRTGRGRDFFVFSEEKMNQTKPNRFCHCMCSCAPSSPRRTSERAVHLGLIRDGPTLTGTSLSRIAHRTRTSTPERPGFWFQSGRSIAKLGRIRGWAG